MPAAAVIPAPIAYIKVVAVKKLVVGFLPWVPGRPDRVCTRRRLASCGRARVVLIYCACESTRLL